MCLFFRSSRENSRRRSVSAVAFCSLSILMFGLFCWAARADENSPDEQTAKVLAMLNDERTKAGLEALKYDSRIDGAAAMHVAEYIKNKEISDQFEGEPSLVERLRFAEIICVAAGEIMIKAARLDQVPELLKRQDVQKVLLDPAYLTVGMAAVWDGPALYIVANLARPLRALSTEEVENLVVDAVQQARADGNLTPFKVVPLPQLRELACNMAKKDSLKVMPVNPYMRYNAAPSQIHNLAFTAGDPRNLPAGVKDVGSDPKLNSVSVGVCFASSRTYPDGTYWVALMMYRTQVQVR